jgi:hypothetical protein
MKTHIVLLGLTLACSVGVPLSDRHNPSLAFSPSHLDERDLHLPQTFFKSGFAADQRRACDKVYPLPDGYENWSDCERGEFTECGGPQQCACIPEQRLVTFRCKQGTYNQCFSWPEDGCPKPSARSNNN